MRISPLLLAAATAAALAAPAGAAGTCTDTVGAAPTCSPGAVCVPGETAVLQVTGNGAGNVRCGGTLTAYCRGLNCTATATIVYAGRLTCTVDPIGTGTATATCVALPVFER